MVHGLHEFGWHLPHDLIQHAAQGLAALVPGLAAAVAWLTTAALDGVLGLTLGGAILATAALAPKARG